MQEGRERATRRSEATEASRNLPGAVLVIGLCAAIGIVGILIWNGVAGRGEQKQASEQSFEVSEQTPAELEGEELARQKVSELTLEQKVAQLFIVRPEALTDVESVTEAGTSTRDAISNYPVCGLLYSSSNFIDSKQVTTMLKSTQNYIKDATGLPAFLCIEEEGGEQSPIAKAYLCNVDVPSASVIGASNEAEEAREAARKIGEYSKKLGFNLNMAPVADIVSSVDSDLSQRSFGDEPTKVATMVSAQVDGYARSKMVCAVKHFPGVGEAEPDPHNDRLYSHRTAEELAQRELVPFKAAIEAGVPIVVVSNMSCIEVGNGEGDVPSWMSPAVVGDMLRGQLGFNGVVMTDMLDDASVKDACDSSEQAVRALKAGADIMVCPQSFDHAYRGVLSAVEKGEISESRIDESLMRIVLLKQQLTD